MTDVPRTQPLSKSERRRQEILQRATECFDRKGYANTTLDDIAKAVGIKREGIYYYFDHDGDFEKLIICDGSASDTLSPAAVKR